MFAISFENSIPTDALARLKTGNRSGEDADTGAIAMYVFRRSIGYSGHLKTMFTAPHFRTPPRLPEKKAYTPQFGNQTND